MKKTQYLKVQIPLKMCLMFSMSLLFLTGCTKQAAFEGLAREEALKRFQLSDGTAAYIDTINITSVGNGWDSFLIKVTPSDNRVLVPIRGGLITVNSGKPEIGICVAGLAKYNGIFGGYEYKSDMKIDLCK